MSRNRYVRGLLLSLLAPTLVASCGGGGGTPVDAGPEVDAQIDAPSDAASDAPSDAPSDAASDAPSDAELDAPPDAIPSVCGDGEVTGDEICDDGNTDSGDACDATCANASCLVPVTHATVQAGLDDAACTTLWIFSGTYPGNVTIARNVTVQGVGPAPVILDGAAAGSVLTIDAGSTVGLRSLVVRNGQAAMGGGIYNQGALTLTNVTVEANHASNAATAAGGGVYSAGALILDATRIQNNTATATGVEASARGGGVVMAGASLTLTNQSTISGNAANASGASSIAEGGGIYAGASVNITIEAGSTVASNRAKAMDTAGDVWARGGGISSDQTITITLTLAGAGAAITGNTAETETGGRADSRGGGIAISGGAVVARAGSSINSNVARAEGNASSFGASGGIDSGAANVTLTGAEARGNRALGTGSANGGFWSGSANGGQRVLFSATNSTIADNVADAGTTGTAIAGALNAFSPTGVSPLLTITLLRTTISGNKAKGAIAAGGAIRANTGTGAAHIVVNLINSTLSGNAAEAAQSRGGAIYATSGTGMARVDLVIASSTITGNTAASAGGIDAVSGVSSAMTSVSLKNSILFGNTATSNPQCRTTGLSVSSGGYNVVGALTGCSVVGDTATHVTANPGLAPLAANGGPTRTHALAAGSSAVNKGNPAGCTDQTATVLTTDQRGLARVVGARCDIGAYEVQ